MIAQSKDFQKMIAENEMRESESYEKLLEELLNLLQFFQRATIFQHTNVEYSRKLE